MERKLTSVNLRLSNCGSPNKIVINRISRAPQRYDIYLYRGEGMGKIGKKPKKGEANPLERYMTYLLSDATSSESDVFIRAFEVSDEVMRTCGRKEPPKPRSRRRFPEEEEKEAEERETFY